MLGRKPSEIVGRGFPHLPLRRQSLCTTTLPPSFSQWLARAGGLPRPSLAFSRHVQWQGRPYPPGRQASRITTTAGSQPLELHGHRQAFHGSLGCSSFGVAQQQRRLVGSSAFARRPLVCLRSGTHARRQVSSQVFRRLSSSSSAVGSACAHHTRTHTPTGPRQEARQALLM